MTAQQRYEGLQSLFLTMHHESCHFLVLCSIIDEYNQDHGLPPLDFLEALHTCRLEKWITKDFWVTDDGTPFLTHYTNAKWTRKEVVKLPLIRDNDYTEAVWYNPATFLHHYRRRYFDTLDHSKTVAQGYIEKYYIYTVED